MTDTMAARLVAHGQPLQVTRVELAEPGPGEVLVSMRRAGVNPIDRYAVAGRSAPDAPLPRTVGMEGVGDVDGRLVLVRGHGIGVTRDGLWAGAAVVPAEALVEVPAGVDPDRAAGMGIAGVTAWRAVTDLGRVGPDDRVLVLGASGGVGSIAVSLAGSLGAEVWAQTGDAANAGWLAEQGADRVVVAADPGELERAAGELQPTVVVDPLGDGFTGAAIAAMSTHGRLVIFGTSAAPEGTVPLQALYRKGITVLGYAGLIEPEQRLAEAARAALQALADGRLRVVVGAVVPLAEVNEALERLGARGVRGKLVLDLTAG